MSEVIPAISLALSSYQTLKDFATSMINVRDAKVFAGKIGEFDQKLQIAQAAVFAVNEERATLLELITKLKKQIHDHETWMVEKARYELSEPTPGFLVYIQKAGIESPERDHYLCTNCYQQNHKSFLLKVPKVMGTPAFHGGGRLYRCPRCKTEIVG